MKPTHVAGGQMKTQKVRPTAEPSHMTNGTRSSLTVLGPLMQNAL